MAGITAYVVDACALIAFFRDEPGGEQMEQLFSQEAEKRFLIHAVNLGEIYYDTVRTSRAAVAMELFKDIKHLPITVIWNIDEPLLIVVGRFKTQHRISYADAYVLALAEREGAAVISADHHEFDAIEKLGVVAFKWIR